MPDVKSKLKSSEAIVSSGLAVLILGLVEMASNLFGLPIDLTGLVTGENGLEVMEIVTITVSVVVPFLLAKFQSGPIRDLVLRLQAKLEESARKKVEQERGG